MIFIAKKQYNCHFDQTKLSPGFLTPKSTTCITNMHFWETVQKSSYISLSSYTKTYLYRFVFGDLAKIIMSLPSCNQTYHYRYMFRDLQRSSYKSLLSSYTKAYHYKHTFAEWAKIIIMSLSSYTKTYHYRFVIGDLAKIIIPVYVIVVLH